ncbi:Acyl-CoA N-acyltransferase [Penicillium nucicola]|uniref:Acyl-CoA N-acyltransferase n=1 Tax=Penicillium nucicola TaxID=1850975 RepID=UPI00254562DF|nr:Acyl-CoA N-acyltransferase [Penicillium nucicola]KAJ5771216.1 Acyl-CoA N-acyltransferase [Penicillium nucicola]
MAIEVVNLTEADIVGAIEVIQQAFADDPYFKWVFDEDKFNKARNHDSLTARCHWGIENAIFQVAKESTPTDPDSQSKVLGVSCWLPPSPPKTPQTWSSYLSSWTLTFTQIKNNIRYLGRGGLRTNRYWIWKERQAEAQAKLWTDEQGYYFCNIVAVAPEAQGKGVGRLLFEAVTKRADEEGRRCYLESSKDVPNVAIYRKLGFEMGLTMECKDGEDACMLYCMVRDPKAE